ncbi:MAG: hypothetical protein WBJ13_14370 [Sedimentibacter sp.]
MIYIKEMKKSMKLIFFCCIGTTFGTFLVQYLMLGKIINIGVIAFGQVLAFIVLTAIFTLIEIKKTNKSNDAKNAGKNIVMG